ncbi:organic cation transporter protein isoform X1 [Episyrphus balteatus]|uniref:organic cation transporter protein isoform X1 n=1 Tax=Episyrphus balteatus TaxID=286459 RepID=UPI00248636B6|nr:organic cation transporter protein isoform X1 [Episyrphus balteatus]
MASSAEKPFIVVKEDDLKEIVSDELDRIGTGGKWVWTLFFLCITPNILNGFHVSSYVLIGHIPEKMWCDISELKDTNWTPEQIKSITEADLQTNGCTIRNWDYTQLAKMSYNMAYNYTNRVIKPNEISCTVKGRYEFSEPETTFVRDWQLVCDKSVQRTSAQVAISIGKFLGSFTLGIFADAYGRKASFIFGSVLFVISSTLISFTPWYSLFLAGRFGLGVASSGLFYPAFSLLSENISVNHRSWMSIAFSASYPIGMVILAVTGYLVQPWRDLQMTLTIPSFLLILNCYLMFESPRWLMTQNRSAEAYRIVFKKDCDYLIENGPEIVKNKRTDDPAPRSLWQKMKEGPLKQFIALYGNSNTRRLAFTCYFMFCVTSLSYYVTALNAHNLSVNRFLYVGITGMVDIPCFAIPMILLKITGRRNTTMLLYFGAGSALLAVLAVPAGNANLVVLFAMMGRFGITAVYSIVTLYTAELFPTAIRNSALGTCSTMAHVGSISAPYVVDILGLLGWYIPTTICGCSVLLASLLTFTLPETSSGNLDHIEDDSEKESIKDSEEN